MIDARDPLGGDVVAGAVGALAQQVGVICGREDAVALRDVGVGEGWKGAEVGGDDGVEAGGEVRQREFLEKKKTLSRKPEPSRGD